MYKWTLGQLGKTNPNEPKRTQNEPKFKKAKMNVTSYITKGYENISNWAICENEPKTNPNKPNFTSAQRCIKAARCRISALGPRSSVHERDEKNRSPRLLIDPIFPCRRGDCIKKAPALKQGNGYKEHCIARWKC